MGPPCSCHEPFKPGLAGIRVCVISARTSQNLVVLSPSAAFHIQQENAGFFETGFLEQKRREPSVKGISSGDLP